MNAACYAIFAAVVICQLWLFFRERRLVLLKIITSTIIVTMVALLASSFTSWLGWPAVTPTSGRFQLVKVIIINGVPGQRGRIYAWMIPQDNSGSRNPFVYQAAANAPRAFEIAQNYEKKMQQAQQSLESGKGVFIQFGKDGEEGQSGKNKKNAQELNDDDPSAPRITVFEPEAQLPPKGDDE